jgi:hypothetical protein
VPQRILIEEFLRGSDARIPDDFKLMVFGGRCRFVQVDYDRHGDHRRDVFTLDWERVPVDYNYPRSDDGLESPPDRLGEMIEIAERLADGHDFVRVDLYALPDRVVFGELTVYPASGNGPFDPADFGVTIGERLKVSSIYR